MSDTWIGVIAGLGGVLLGGGFGLANSVLQRRWQIQERQVLVEQTRQNEVRRRMDAKADEVLGHLTNLETVLFRNILLSRVDLWPNDEARKATRSLLNEIAIASGYLTNPLRKHVHVVVNLVPDAERLVQQGWVDDTSARAVAQTAVRWAKRNVERYLRGDAIPHDRGEPIGSYVDAWDDMNDHDYHEIEAAEAGQREAPSAGSPDASCDAGSS